jgi:transcriptional regulator with XRE-family HTH domain
MDYKKFGSNIRKQRQLAELTIEQLAEKAGIGDNFLGKIERGQATPSLETTIKISDALNCGVDLLLSGELKHVTEYLERDISDLIDQMDANNRRIFLEFIKINGAFFTKNKL